MQRRRTAWLWRIGAVIGAALALTLVAWFDNEANRGVVREPRGTPVRWADVPQLGVNLHNIQYEPDPAVVTRTLEAAQALGARTVRLQLPWDDVEIHGKGDFVDRRHMPARSAWEKYDFIIAEARRLGLPVSVHLNNSRARAGGIARVAKDGLLGPDLQAIHAVWVTPDEVRALADARAAVSLSPYTELRIGFGVPPTSTFLQAGIPLGLSVDTTALSGNADMFGIMKVTQNAENARTENEFQLPARRVLELATIEGARSMGMGDRIGSLTAGKRADLIMVDTRAINLGVFTDPAHLLVEAAQPANVDTVMVDGRLLKRGGRLTAVDPGRVVGEARQSLAALRKRANWW